MSGLSDRKSLWVGENRPLLKNNDLLFLSFFLSLFFFFFGREIISFWGGKKSWGRTS